MRCCMITCCPVYRHVSCPGAFYLQASILAKHDDLRYFWVLRLIVIAIMCCMAGTSLMKWFAPHEIRPKATRILDPGFYRICRILCIFSKIWFGKRQNWIGRERGYKRHRLQQKQIMNLPYFGQYLESKKKVVWILVHVRPACIYLIGSCTEGWQFP